MVNERQKMILAELRLQYKEGLKCWDSLDHKLIATLFVGFLGVLFIGLQPETIPWHRVFLSPCVYVVVLSLIGLQPQTTRSPVRLEWEAIWSEFLLAGDDDAYRQLVSNYLDAFSKNKHRSLLKAWSLRLAMLSLVFQLFGTLSFVI